MTAFEGLNAGRSTCPICGKHWLVTPEQDCLMPYCGCYGLDHSEANPNRPCEPCGLIHIATCPKTVSSCDEFRPHPRHVFMFLGQLRACDGAGRTPPKQTFDADEWKWRDAPS